MKVAAQPTDAERAVVDYLADALADQPCTVGVGVPAAWIPGGSPHHVEVASDGEPDQTWPVVVHATIRVVAHADTTSAAKSLCGRAFGLLCAHPGGDTIATTRPLTGVLPARDPETYAELASATVRVSMRTAPIT